MHSTDLKNECTNKHSHRLRVQQLKQCTYPHTHTQAASMHGALQKYFAMHKMQCSHSDWCSFVVLHFVHDIYFSVSFICVLLCSERKITLTDK